MKKLLGIVVLGLLLSSNAYAASKFTYLSCPAAIRGVKYTDNELYKVGKYIGHSFIMFKDTKKKSTTVTVYYQGGNVLKARDPNVWMSIPPIKLLKEKFKYESRGYSFKFFNQDLWRKTSIKTTYDPSGGEIFVYEHTVKFKDTLLLVSSNRYTNAKKEFDNIDFCEEVDKKEFNELIKKGIK